MDSKSELLQNEIVQQIFTTQHPFLLLSCQLDTRVIEQCKKYTHDEEFPLKSSESSYPEPSSSPNSDVSLSISRPAKYRLVTNQKETRANSSPC